MRTGWLLAASLLCYALTALAARWLPARAFAGLFAAWGINGDNVNRAPLWAQLVYGWHGVFIDIIAALAALALCRFLRRLWRLPPPQADAASLRAGGRAALAGLAMALLAAALSLIPDSSRLEWPLNVPRLGWGLPALCAVSLLAALAEETFGKAVLLDGLRARWGDAWATAAACAFFFAVNLGWTGGVLGGVNALLLALATCLLYRRRGLWASTGLRWGLGAATAFLLGFGGGDHAAYRLYGVSETMLTGGDAGPMRGLWMTVLLLAALCWLGWERFMRRRG